MSNWDSILRVDGNAPLLPIEQERLERIRQNQKRMMEMGLLKQVSIMESMKSVKPHRQLYKTDGGVSKKVRGQKPCRASARLKGVQPEYAETVDPEDRAYEPLEDLLADDTPIAEMNEQQKQELQERRCTSQGRGSIYDSALGITCHFCRQKKLCGEADCPRCSLRDAQQECTGKTECSRCAGATGRFCRACLLIRYGEEMEGARERMARGEWLCPHCYEEENPGSGWICNSSICMKRAGRAPTGIAIFEAQRRGFPSVAHWLQAQYKRKYGGNEGSTQHADNSSSGEQQQQQPKERPKCEQRCPGAQQASNNGKPSGARRSGRLTGSS